MKIIRRVIPAVLAGIFMFPQISSADRPELKDSGINYNESVSTLNNPGAGYTNAIWYECSPGNTPVYNPEGNLAVLFIDIGGFSSGANGVSDDKGNYTEGKDYDLDEAFFSGVRKTLENCRNNGCTAGIRFRYDAVGKTNPEPSSFSKVLDHISQIKADGMLDDYEDILVYVESGFTGAWGEQHSGKYTSVEYKARLLDAVLDAVPESVSVTVRTPDTFCKWAGITADELADYTAEEGSDAARVGMYNDGYMGSDSDLGTYSSVKRDTAVKWMENQMKHAYYGGEFSGNTEFAQQYETYLPENSVSEMYRTHLSYINSNIWELYKGYTFGAEYDTSGAGNSSYHGETVYRFIRDHIGYRFVLRDCKLTPETVQGGSVTAEFSIENTGFADVIKKQDAYVILEKDGRYIITETDTDSSSWESTETSAEKLELKLPGNMEPGEWNVYLKLSCGNGDITDTLRTVAFANESVYSSSLGANYLGTVTVNAAENPDSDNSFSEKGAESKSDGTVYSCRGKITVDGEKGEYEWTEDDIAVRSGESCLYVKCDDNYMYVCAQMPDTASAPVYNLSLQGTEEGDREYWTYYASGGFVYFNGEDNSGIRCRYNGGTAEFCIPFGECMELYSGRELKYLRVDIQDSADGWKVTGDLKTGNITVKSSVIHGDLNSDGTVNAADLLIMYRYFLNTNAAVSIDKSAADMNSDRIINIQDLIKLKQLFVK